MQDFENLIRPAPKKPGSFMDAWTTWRRGGPDDPTNNEQFLTAIKPIISQATSLYGGSGRSTVYSNAKRLALEAAAKYNPEVGDLKSHLLQQLQSLRRVAANQSNLLQVPEQVRFDASKLRAVEQEFRDELGRDASDAEIADRTGLSTKRIAHVRGFRPGFTASQIEQLTKGDDRTEGLDPSVRRIDPFESRLGLVYDTLPPRDQLIVDYSLGRNGRARLGTNEIASRLGISASLVSQRLRNVQTELDAVDQLGVF